jgi:ribosomal RNA-processing protein 7
VISCSILLKLPCRIYSDPDELRKKVDNFMIEYDRNEAELRRNLRQVEVDEDGFTLVKPSFTNSVMADAPVSRKKRKSSEGLSDFYRFQLKERKVDEWNQTRRQEALDKEYLNNMRSSNKFQL